MTINIIDDKATQNERLLAHLKERGSISVMEALTVHGITRLAARIYDLKSRGYNIIPKHRRDEAGHRYTRYHLQTADAK